MLFHFDFQQLMRLCQVERSRDLFKRSDFQDFSTALEVIIKVLIGFYTTRPQVINRTQVKNLSLEPTLH